MQKEKVSFVWSKTSKRKEIEERFNLQLNRKIIILLSKNSMWVFNIFMRISKISGFFKNSMNGNMQRFNPSGFKES